jgi:hypothetical protein
LAALPSAGTAFDVHYSVGPRAGLEVLEVQIKLLRLPGIEPLFWVFQSVSQSLYQPIYSGSFVNISNIQIFTIFIFGFSDILVVKFLMKVKKILNNFLKYWEF